MALSSSAFKKRFVSFFRGSVLAYILALIPVLGLTLAQPSTAQAASSGPFGLGIVLGEPTALTFKYWMNRDRALDGGIAFNFDRWLLLYADWDAHFPGALGHSNSFLANTSPYLGLGGLLVFSNRNDWETRHDRYFSETSSSRTALGLRIPLGLEWRPPTVPVGVFLELVPGLTIIPGTYGFIQGGLGARYFF